MKRRILSVTLTMALILALAGCEKKDETTVSSISETPIESTETSVSSEASVETSTEDTGASTASDEEKLTGQALYEAFMAGEAKAMVTAEGDKGQYYTFTNAMTAGESYTLNEIITNLSDNMEQNGWDKRPTLGEIYKEYIDCGMDGKEELHVRIELPVEGIEDFTVDMVIVEKDGALKIAYDADSWSRSEVTVGRDGYIMNGGSAGASVHVGDVAIIDGNGDYKFISQWEENTEVMAADYYVSFSKDPIKVDLSSVDTDDLSVSLFTLKEDPKAEDIMVTLYKGFDGEEYDASSPAGQAFTNVGIKVVSEEESHKIMSDWLVEQGYK
ncbi:MAG: hypothetical protein J5811_07930 [Lachnospiraceae bacterium]|nr:hypothetical protein [Lachnospiraceae bacterium]MBR5761813.1 hypothetical protein [Lachnospiraceae bacterium]MBR5993340.1 hypothetical protein [Lachnospiraceae bacterium]